MNTSKWKKTDKFLMRVSSSPVPASRLTGAVNLYKLIQFKRNENSFPLFIISS